MRGLMIANGRRGGASALELAQLAARLDCELCVTSEAAEGCRLAQKAVSDGARLIVAVGGDGTFNGLCNVVAGTPTALAMVPAGTANDLASHLHVTLHDWLATKSLCECVIRRIDLIRVNHWLIATVGGCGFAALVLQKAAVTRPSQSIAGTVLRHAGRWTYLAAAGLSFGRAATSWGEVEIETDTEKASGEFMSVLIANQPRLGHTFEVAPGARNDDGQCVLALYPAHRSKLSACLTVGSAVLPRLLKDTRVRRLRARQIRIRCEHEVDFFGDGELRLCDSEFRVEVLPRALNVLLPAKSAVRSAGGPA